MVVSTSINPRLNSYIPRCRLKAPKIRNSSGSKPSLPICGARKTFCTLFGPTGLPIASWLGLRPLFWGGLTFLGGFNPSGGVSKLGLNIQGRHIREPTSLVCCWGGFFFLEIGEFPNKNLGVLFPVSLPKRNLVGGVFTLGYGLRTPKINTKQKWKDKK